MRFELLDSISLPGNPAKPNEDSFSHSLRFASVFDGATVLGEHLMPGRSDAQWVAQFGSRRLRAYAEDGHAPRDALRAAVADAEKSFTALRRRPPAEGYETPYASLIALFIGDEGIDALWFGDCGAVVRTPNGELSVVGDTIGSRSHERDRVSKLTGPDGVASTEVREKFLPSLRASRNRVNTKGGSWLFSPDVRCAKHANATRLAPSDGSMILLASDGFFALVSDYARYTVDELIAAAQSRGLAALGQELREIETADPKGVTYPRFKSSDDATALLLSVNQ